MQIALDGVEDVPLMELASRKGYKDFVASLAKCIERDDDLSAWAKAEWKCVKENGVKLFSPDKGGRYEVFNDRPI